MKIMNSSRFRSFMKTELDLIESTNVPLCITTVRKDNPQQMVIISKELYDINTHLIAAAKKMYAMLEGLQLSVADEIERDELLRRARGE